MSDHHYLDNEMTKQQLQMENRRLRLFLTRLSDIATRIDLALGGKDAELHMECERLLLEVNRVARETA